MSDSVHSGSKSLSTTSLNANIGVVNKFMVPTAQELESLIHGGIGDGLSTQDEQDNCFTSLLNQGSSLE